MTSIGKQPPAVWIFGNPTITIQPDAIPIHCKMSLMTTKGYVFILN